MNELTIQNYEQLKTELSDELNKAANSFVRIGYLLRLARDNKTILDGSGYTDVNEFASKEFDLDKTQVSRFIRINERFSLGGNSEQLLPEYAEYGSAKLSIMLTLPDEINEELSPEYSKSDIQAIKDEYEAEQKITDVEVMLEDKDEDAPDEFMELIVKQLNDEHEDPIAFLHESHMMAEKLGTELGLPDVQEAYIPDGDKTYTIRIAGQGRYMVSMKESGIAVVNMRDMVKSPLSWEEFTKLTLTDEAKREFKAPEKPKPKEKPKKVEKSKPKPKKEPKPEAKAPEPVAAEHLKPEDTEEQSSIQRSLLEEIETLTGWIKQERWRNARDVAEDIVDRLKHIGG